jgi:hypothetical protein
MFPPAALPPAAAIANYQTHQRSEHAWMLRWLVVGAAELGRVPRELDGSLAVLGDADEPRAAVLETRRIVRAKRPVYCEVPLSDLDEVKRAGCLAKIRTGGLKPEAVPSVEDVAAFLRACADRRLPFKATAGLHHPIRARHVLTAEPDGPRAVVHGFLNVFLAAAFSWYGERTLEPILAETDPDAFRFDERAHWRDRSLEAGQVREAREQFAHAFGSCSFVEPVQDLEALGLL